MSLFRCVLIGKLPRMVAVGAVALLMALWLLVPAAVAQNEPPATDPPAAATDQPAQPPADSTPDASTQPTAPAQPPADSAAQPSAPADAPPASDTPAETPPAEATTEPPSGTANTEGEAPPEDQGKKPEEAEGWMAWLSGPNRLYALLVITLLTFLLPAIAAYYVSEALRVRDLAVRLFLVFFAVTLSIVVNVVGWPPKLGIDLSGGVILNYEVNRQALEQEAGGIEVDSVLMDKLVAAVIRRVNPGGIKEVTVRPYGPTEIEITIPQADEQELAQIKNIISQAGALEFRIVANRRVDSEIIESAMQTSGNTVFRRVPSTGEQVPIALWVPLHPDAVADYANDPNFATRPATRMGKPVTQILVLKDRHDVTGQYLRRANPSFDRSGRPSVHFEFDSVGASRFGSLTGENLPNEQQNLYRLLAIILDGELYSAPRIQSIIQDNGEITGDFTPERVAELAAVLTAGQLPAALVKEPTTERVTGPTLGADMIKKGVTAMLISTVCVVVFMLIYYGPFAGTMANLAVVLNVALTVAFMIMFNARFTLAGLAGLALTVGMAVDANVLIYERMREELSRGATLRMAIRNGFDRATTTIVDANVTTLITAIVLFVIGTEQVKGFAVTLILGILMNLFTAITCTRTLFELAERVRLIRKLSFMQILTGSNFDFIGKRYYAFALSFLIIGVGMAGVVARGSGLLDIDFTGGSSVEVVFDNQHGQPIAAVREAVAQLPDVTVQDTRLSDEPADLRYTVVTSIADVAAVEDLLRTAFAGKLATNHLRFEQVEPIPGTASAAEPFAGGTSVVLRLSSAISHFNLRQAIEAALTAKGHSATLALELAPDDPAFFTQSNTRYDKWNLRIALPAADTEPLLAQVEQQFASSPFFPSSSKIGAAVADNTKGRAATAILFSLVLILGYVWLRFKQLAFGYAAVLALLHDVLFTLGMLALSYWLALLPGMSFLLIEPFKINLVIVSAFLTIIGYSLNDTIVIFDRIREIRGKSPDITGDLINTAVNQTLSRTILTSLTVFIVVIILYAFGGQGIHGFAYALVVGTISGTYSTIFIASPALLWLSSSPKSRGMGGNGSDGSGRGGPDSPAERGRQPQRTL